MIQLESASFGSTGRTVSRLGFGGAPAGLTNYLGQYSPRETKQREEVIAAIQHAADSGITYFDTAASYGDGASERIFGEALAGRVTSPAHILHANPPETHPRSNGQPPEAAEPGVADWQSEQLAVDGRLFVATKVSHAEPEVRGSIERSLRHLRMDRIDLVQIHGGSYTEEQEHVVMKPGGVLEILESARDEGLVRHIGFTTEDQNAAVYNFIASGRFDVMQVQYNLMFQHPYSPDRPFGCMVAAKKAGMGIVTMRSLTSGVFQRWMKAIRPDDDFDYSAALLQFTLSNRLVDVALAGMRTPAEVDGNVAVLTDTAGRVDLDYLHEKYV